MFTAKSFYGSSRAVRTGPTMDVDTPSRNKVLVLPDADVSEPEVEEDSDEEPPAEPESEESSDPSHSGEEEVSRPSIVPPKKPGID